jgi:cell division protein FtsI/penicillin-binding protein 2
MIQSETAETVMRMMESVIQSEHGTGRTLQIPGYRLAGKTGTAQKVGTADGKYVANFVGMVPAQDPRAVIPCHGRLALGRAVLRWRRGGTGVCRHCEVCDPAVRNPA